jgi:hypothetical protein
MGVVCVPQPGEPEDRERSSTPTEISDDEPEADALEQRQEVPYREDDQ